MEPTRLGALVNDAHFPAPVFQVAPAVPVEPGSSAGSDAAARLRETESLVGRRANWMHAADKEEV